MGVQNFRLSKQLILTLRSALFLIFSVSIVTACVGGGGGGGGGNSSPILEGYFIDSPVDGIEYTNSSGTGGTTGNKGEFQYKEGDTVTFSVGGIVIGSVAGNKFITPTDLKGLSNDGILNVVRLLLTLDEDKNPDNGITITAAVLSKAQNLTASTDNFNSTDFESSDLAIFAKQANDDNRPLVNLETAKTHLVETEKDLADGQYDGPTDTDGDGIRDEVDESPPVC